MVQGDRKSLELELYTSPSPQSPPKVRRQQMDLISEIKRKQQKEPLIYESDRDGAIEDIITGGGLAGAVLSWACPTLSSIHPNPGGRDLSASLPLCSFFLSFSLFPFSPGSFLATLSAQDGALHCSHRQEDVQAPL